ncbi:MAG: hypothetical protein CTY38_01035 [Methylotenera sp.]|uniref:hypothetical protein n=1 Tax=Methylotenera sp. TaxID=2051956 RepID=UPI000D413B11|nr:hypothetical protein [Methylotenera sp.]PPC84663.1 MAG: hypothetical protein CTY38_01035 [Methylotenera sp.]
MSNSNQYAINRARSIKERFINKMASIDLKKAVAIPVVIGTAAVMAGIGVEVHHQGELLNQGMQALQEYLQQAQAYRLMYDPSMNEYIKAGVSGEIPAAGAKLQAGGIGVLLYGTAVTTAVATLAKGFANIAKNLAGEARETVDKNTNNASAKLDTWRTNRATQVADAALTPTFKS